MCYRGCKFVRTWAHLLQTCLCCSSCFLSAYETVQSHPPTRLVSGFAGKKNTVVEFKQLKNEKINYMGCFKATSRPALDVEDRFPSN